VLMTPISHTLLSPPPLLQPPPLPPNAVSSPSCCRNCRPPPQRAEATGWRASSWLNLRSDSQLAPQSGALSILLQKKSHTQTVRKHLPSFQRSLSALTFPPSNPPSIFFVFFVAIASCPSRLVFLRPCVLFLSRTHQRRSHTAC
jgi:hypothetical protein